MCLHTEALPKPEFIQLTEQTIFRAGSKEFKVLDNLCFLSKNLYNAALYENRQRFLKRKEGEFLGYSDLDKYMKDTDNPDYRALKSKVAQWTLKLEDLAWKSFFASLKDYQEHPKKYKGRPKLPGYLDSKTGRQTAHFTIQAINKRHYDKTKEYKLSGVDDFSLKSKVPYENVKMIRVVHNGDHVTVEVIYEVLLSQLMTEGISAALDPGMTNFATIVFSDPRIKPFVISGKYLKSVNNQYNKEIAKIDSLLNTRTYKKETEEFNKKVEENKKLKEKGEKTDKVVYKGKKKTKKRSNVSYKRKTRIKDAMHKYSRFIVNQLVIHRVSTLFVGKNKNWKQDIKLGDKTNQNFVQIPYCQFFDMLKYKCRLVGIKVVFLNESYTSKCSFYDLEKICKHKENAYAGTRIHRGLFKTKDGILINADVNGAYNILRRGLKCLEMDDSIFCKENIDKFKRHPKIITVPLH